MTGQEVDKSALCVRLGEGGGTEIGTLRRSPDIYAL